MATTLEKEVIKEICATGDKTSTIPETTQSGSNALSYADGFPIATSTPQSDNGIPPKRTDMNKVLNMLSKNQVFLQNGGAYSFDSSVSTAIGGYPKGARLLYTDIGGQKYTIESLKDNNISSPTSANIYSVTNLKKAEGIVDEVSPDLPTATQDRLGQIYLAQAPVTSTKPVGTKAFMCQQGGNGYTWGQYNISTLFVDGTTIFVNDTKEYYGIINGSFGAIGYDGLNSYKWIYIPDTPATSEAVSYCVTKYALEHLVTGTKETVYQTTKPTVVIFGALSMQTNKSWFLDVSTDGVNFKTIAGAKLQLASETMQSVILDKDLYWQVRTDISSTSDYRIEYSSLY